MRIYALRKQDPKSQVPKAIRIRLRSEWREVDVKRIRNVPHKRSYGDDGHGGAPFEARTSKTSGWEPDFCAIGNIMHDETS